MDNVPFCTAERIRLLSLVRVDSRGVDTRRGYARERERERERERGAKKGLKRKESRERRESMKHNVDRGKGNNRKEQHLWRRVHNFVSYFRSGGTNDAHLY